jgi:hypothetical protein
MSITKNGDSLVFDQVLLTSSGAITGVLMQPHVIPHAHVGVDVPTQEDVPNAQDTVETPNPIVEAPPEAAPIPERPMVTRDVNDLHHMFGHAHFDAIKRSGKYYNIELKGDAKTCVACALAKIRQKNINKVTLSKSLKPGDRIYVDISGTIWRSYGGAKYWVLIVDDSS